VIQERGFTLFIAGAIITTVTIAITLILLIFSKNINFFSITGGLSGLMTNPSALAAAKSQTETAIPMLGYATIFPFAMILKIAFIQVLMVIILSLK
jgi:putative transport protein